MAEWIIIIERIIKAIQECRENRSREQIRAGLLNPGVVETMAFRRVLRSQGLRGRKLRTAMTEGFGQLAALGSACIDELLDEAEEAQ